MDRGIYILLIGISLLSACAPKPKKPVKPQLEAASFCSDSAYQFIQDQVAFTPRVPGTAAHSRCIDYLSEQLQRFGCEVELQTGVMTNYEGKAQPVTNIIGHHIVSNEGVAQTSNNTLSSRFLLCAHYDSRPWADQEEEYDNRQTPVPGANDGASGVGVLLEIARQLDLLNKGGNSLKNNVDIVFFDCEDMGTPDFYTEKQQEDTWCLGSQLWAQNYVKAKADGRITKTYDAAILLDMVGSPDAVFPKEYYSMLYARRITEKVWQNAEKLGYTRYFSNELAYPIIDDHYYINTIASIPAIDIIHYDQRSESGFAHYWHTVHDDMTNINRNTLQAVGEVVLTTITN